MALGMTSVRSKLVTLVVGSRARGGRRSPPSTTSSAARCSCASSWSSAAATSRATSPTTPSTACSPRTSRCSPSSSRARSASGMAEGSDVVGAMIRDAQGRRSSSRRARPSRTCPPLPAAELEERDAVTSAGEPGDPLPGARDHRLRGRRRHGGRARARLPDPGQARRGPEGRGRGRDHQVAHAIPAAAARCPPDHPPESSPSWPLGALGGWYLVGRWFRAPPAHGGGLLGGGQGRPHRRTSRSRATTRSAPSPRP